MVSPRPDPSGGRGVYPERRTLASDAPALDELARLVVADLPARRGVVESPQLTLDIAGTLKEIAGSLGVPFVFKASYDKANRSSRSSFREPRLEPGQRPRREPRRQSMAAS